MQVSDYDLADSTLLVFETNILLSIYQRKNDATTKKEEQE